MPKQMTFLFAGLVLFAFVVTAFAAPQISTRDSQLTVNSQQSTWEYARLVTNGEQATWHAGETNAVPQTFPLNTVYKQLGGRSRANLTNLLNQIGKDGWELVSTDESNWTFKRRN